jgi:steroid delta-isomerase-like uncharacterized protein
MRITSIGLCTIIVAAAGLAPTGCKKKEEPVQVTSDDKMGVEGRRSTDPRRTTQPRVEPTTGPAIAAKYSVCLGHVNAGNWDRFKADCIADDFVLHEVDDRDIPGPDGLVEQLRTMKAAFPDWKIQPQLVMVSGQNILAIGLTTGTHEQPLKTPTGELAATNKKVGQLFFHRLAITDDLEAKEEWLFSDMGTMMSQLGQLPREAQAMRPAMDKGIEGAPIVVTAADDQKEMANIETVKKWNAAFSAHDVNELMALYADDAIESDHAMAVDYKGKQEIEKLNRSLFGAFSDGKVDVPSLFAAGDYVVALGKFMGTNDGDMPEMKMKKSGNKVEFSYAEVLQLKDGKIAQVWRFRNGMALAKQLGMMPEGGKMDARGKIDQPSEPAKKR